MTEKVYLIVSEYYDETEVLLVFRNKENAVRFCNDAYGEPINKGFWKTTARRCISIQEYEVND